MRRRLAAALMPALVIAAGAAPAAAAAPPGVEPVPGTVIINKVSPVVQYRLFSVGTGDEDQEDAGTVQIDYTCYPSDTDDMPETVELVAYLSYGRYGGFQNERWGTQIACDGGRHRIDVALWRWSGSPFTPENKRVPGVLHLQAHDCIFCEDPIVTEFAPIPVRLNFLHW